MLTLPPSEIDSDLTDIYLNENLRDYSFVKVEIPKSKYSAEWLILKRYIIIECYTILFLSPNKSILMV